MTNLAPELAALLADPIAIVDAAWAEAWAPKAALLVSEWAQLYRILPEVGAAEPGPWRNERNPHLVEIMDCLAPAHPCEKVVFKKPTQVGGTEVLINFLGYAMSHEPGPIMLIVPGIDMAERHSKQRIAPSIEASPEWSRHVKSARSRDSGNTVRVKEFRGGILVIVTANSSAGLRSMPVRYLLADEVDKFLRNLDGEGSALELGIRRTSTYQGRRKIYECSSPTIKGDSLIDDEYEASDQRERHVPCPHCEQRQVLVMEQLLDDGRYLCIRCGTPIEEHHKEAMFARGVWIARFPEREVPGFHLNALYAPYRLGESWAAIAVERARAKGDPQRMILFTNTFCGLAYEGERQQADSEQIEQRAEIGFERRTVPTGCLILTIGVDCQHDRFALTVSGWGRGERNWIIDYDEVPGDPTNPEEGYKELDDALLRTYAKYSGVLLIGRVVAIDGGNWTEDVAKFVRTRQRRLVKCGETWAEQQVLLVRGRSHGSVRVVYRPSKTEVNERGKTLARSVGMWGVGTDVAKTTLFGRLTADANAEQPSDRLIRFPGGKPGPNGKTSESSALPKTYFAGLTSEYFDVQAKKWIHPNKSIRNEPLDTWVYSYFAALCPMVRIDLLREHEWRALEEQLEPKVDLFAPKLPVQIELVPEQSIKVQNVPHGTFSPPPQLSLPPSRFVRRA
jgi:phage terminase large subunit GpA-like protein